MIPAELAAGAFRRAGRRDARGDGYLPRFLPAAALAADESVCRLVPCRRRLPNVPARLLLGSLLRRTVFGEAQAQVGVNEGCLQQPVRDVVRDLKLLVGRDLGFVRGLVPQAPAAVETVPLVVAQLPLAHEFVYSRLQVRGRRSVVSADRLHERADSNARQDRLIVRERVHLLLVDLPDRGRQEMVVVEPPEPLTPRWKEQHVLDGVAFVQAVAAFDLLPHLRGPPGLPEGNPATPGALDDLKAGALVHVVQLAGVAGLDGLEDLVNCFARAALAGGSQGRPC